MNKWGPKRKDSYNYNLVWNYRMASYFIFLGEVISLLPLRDPDPSKALFGVLFSWEAVDFDFVGRDHLLI